MRTFLAVAEAENFGRAASTLRVAQSAVSQTIRALEEEVGAPLFARGKWGARLTEAGERFVPRARRALYELDEGALEVKSVGAGTAGSLTMHLGALSGLTVLPRVIARHRRACPDVAIELVPAAVDEPLAALTEGRADFVTVMASKHDLRGFSSELVTECEIAAVLGARHRLARRRSIAFRDLSGETLLVPEALGALAQSAFARHALEHRFEPDAVKSVGPLDALLGLVAAGAGVSILPSIVAALRMRGVVFVPVRPAPRARLVVVWTDARLSAVGRGLLETLRRERDAQRGSQSNSTLKSTEGRKPAASTSS